MHLVLIRLQQVKWFQVLLSNNKIIFDINYLIPQS